MELLSSNSTPPFPGSTDAKAKASILWPPDGKSQLIGKDPDAGKVHNEMVRWHYRLNGHELEQTLGDTGTAKPGLLQPMVTKSQTRLSD